jgi:hypothetical protein
MTSPTPEEIAGLQKLIAEWNYWHAADRPGNEDYEQRDIAGVKLLEKLEQSPFMEFFESDAENSLAWQKRDLWNARKFAQTFIARFSEASTQSQQLNEKSKS